MTSRLKRKLNDLGVDTQSTKATENFCLIGTPLPPLEKTKDQNEFVPLWKQEVRDEKGRRRLHGAFTGGFSAGYFNSVGSKEGWTPSTFVSSRSDRAKQQAARAEDFMDEEDLAELRESRRLVDENEEMDFASTEAELRKRQGIESEPENDSITSALASALAPPPTESAGARILMKMGWRTGHGIGPRVTYEQRRAQDRTFGISASLNEDEVDEEAKKHMYPRRDTPVLLAPRKENAHGLGYRPGISLNESLGVGGKKGPLGPKLSSGFGLGALNDADEDDLDVYDSSMGPRDHSRVAFDAIDDEERIAMGSSRRGNRSRAIESAPSNITQTLFDGTTVLKGFTLYPEPVVLQNDLYPFPEIPKGWKPNPRRVWDADKSKENITISKEMHVPTQPQSRAEWKESQLSADQRGSILGETPLPTKKRSVFDYLSQKDKERLQSIRGNLSEATSDTKQPAAEPLPPQPTYLPGQVHIPTIHPSVAKAALTGFQPFIADPLKHSRYCAFLNYASQASDSSSSSGLGIGPMPNQSTEEFNKELSDYAKSATVFKPLSGAMAGRFTSSKVVELGPKIIEGLHTPDLSNLDDGEEEDKGENQKENDDPRRGAIRLGMYGPLTREVKSWQPAKLLCKRFGVKEPELEVATDPLDLSSPDPTQASSSKSDATLAPLKAITDGLENKPEGLGESSSSGRRNPANVGLGEDETQGRDTLTYTRPSMDVFKAIFASDDEDSDDEDVKKSTDKDEIPYFSSLMPGDANEVSETPDVKPVVASTSALPKESPKQVNLPEKVDISTFKPTFVPRGDRESRKDKASAKEKKEKKKSKTALVSFDDEEGGLQLNISAPKRKKRKEEKDEDRKKKKRKEKDKAEDDDAMWEEAPPPEIVQKLEARDNVTSVPEVISERSDGRPVVPSQGRARAVDFM
ncbi:hypothetical protein QCA50_010535 [Cerrena zonata]|uniref:G-patch domain-containing protein n=1 Tax=Cerrena zonata TaxID=2478898 RepID=A0AAW0G9L8_9APHY